MSEQKFSPIAQNLTLVQLQNDFVQMYLNKYLLVLNEIENGQQHFLNCYCMLFSVFLEDTGTFIICLLFLLV